MEPVFHGVALGLMSEPRRARVTGISSAHHEEVGGGIWHLPRAVPVPPDQDLAADASRRTFATDINVDASVATHGVVVAIVVAFAVEGVVVARVALPADAGGTQENVLKPKNNTEDWRVSAPWDMLRRP